MSSILNKMFKGKRKWISMAIILVLIVVGYRFLGGNGKDTFTQIKVERKDLKQEVLVSGIVKAQTDVNLAFEKSGTISWVSKKTNDQVFAGETIISLQNASEIASVNEAKALLDSKIARYTELESGSRPEEILVKEIAVRSEKQTLTNYYNSVPETINDAFNNVDNAVNKQSDDMFSNDNTSNPQLTFNVYDQQVKNDVISLRTVATNIISDLNTINNQALSQLLNKSESEESLNQAKNDLIKIQEFLVKLTEALNKSSGLSDTTLASYKTSVATGRTNVNTALQSVTTLIENIESQKIAVEKIESELALLKLGATSSVLAQAESDIKQAEAKLANAEASLQKTILKAPVSGIISKLDVNRGELVQAGEIVVSIVGNKNFIVEANLPEADLAKVGNGDKTEITLDTFGEDRIFYASLISIEPAERIIDGVATYKTTFAFADDTNTTSVKPGMTANLTIITNEKLGVLTIPTSAIEEIDGKNYVTVLKSGVEEQVEIQTGLRQFTLIEVVSGLNEDEIVLVPNKTN